MKPHKIPDPNLVCHTRLFLSLAVGLVKIFFRILFNTVRASTFSRTELLAYRTKLCYIDTPKKSSFRQKIFDLPKVRFGTVREKVDAPTVSNKTTKKSF